MLEQQSNLPPCKKFRSHISACFMPAWSLEALGHCSLPASVLLEFSCSAITSIVALFALCRPRRQHRGSKCPCYAWADSPFQTKKTSEEILGRLQHLVL